MADDLTRRLRCAGLEYADGVPVGYGEPFNPDGPEAADEIDRLRAALAAVESQAASRSRLLRGFLDRAKGLRARAEKAERERDAAREALRPFAAEADEWAASVPDDYRPPQPEMQHKGRALPGSEALFCIGDLRRALSALTPARNEKED